MFVWKKKIFTDRASDNIIKEDYKWELIKIKEKRKTIEKSCTIHGSANFFIPLHATLLSRERSTCVWSLNSGIN